MSTNWPRRMEAPLSAFTTVGKYSTTVVTGKVGEYDSPPPHAANVRAATPPHIPQTEEPSLRLRRFAIEGGQTFVGINTVMETLR